MPYDEEPKSEPDKGLDEQKEDKFSFLQETIKPETVTKKKILAQLARVGIYGLIFGAFACLGFFALKPWAKSSFQGNPETVNIPKDEAPQAAQDQPSTVDQAEPPVLDVESFKAMMKSVYTIAKEADKCVATVKPVREEDALAIESGTVESVTALILADNGQELLLLSDSSISEGADRWKATFSDNGEYDAVLKKKDKNSGFAVFSVSRTKITDATWNAIKLASLGNSNIMSKGDVVIALGNTFGYADGVGYGIISSTVNEEVLPDSQRTVLGTDIAAEAGGTGVLFNMKGEAIGMIAPGIWGGAQPNTTKALGISDLKATMELLVNGQSVPYVGIYGTTINDALSAAQDMPTGVYVAGVELDSPAMSAGIQSGDIIQEISGTKVSNSLSYGNKVLGTKVGESVKIKGKRRGAGGYVDIDFTVAIGSQE